MPPVELVRLCCVAAFASLLLAAAWQDFHTLRIGNAFPIGIVASFCLWSGMGVLTGGVSPLQIAESCACAVVVFSLAAIGFSVRAVGGGDVKLLAAASLFAGPAHQFDFLSVTAVAGGGLGLAILVGVPIGRTANPNTMAPLGCDSRCAAVPYGPAIAIGGLGVAASLVPSLLS